MNVFSKVNREVKKQAQPKTTVIEVVAYQLDKDPSKAVIKAKDLLNLDPATGQPREVNVYIPVKGESKIRGVKEFGNPGNLVYTAVGGLIRLDRYTVRGNTYTAQHAQRIARDSSMLRQDGSGEKYSVAFDRAWVKIVPVLDRNNGFKPKVFVAGDAARTPMHRGRAYVIPESAAPVVATLGAPDLLESIKQAASAAYDIAPEKTNPFLMFRQKDSLEIMEVELPRAVQIGEREYRPMTKEEMLNVLPEMDKIKGLLDVSAELTETQDAEILPGYRMAVFGAIVGEKGEPIKGRVLEFAETTCRRFAKPTDELDDNGNAKVELVNGRQEYTLSIFSYETPEAEARFEATVATIGRVPGQKPSPNAGLGETPNPFYKNDEEPEVDATADQVAAGPVDPEMAEGFAEEPEVQSASALLADVDDVDNEIAEIERTLAGANLT